MLALAAIADGLPASALWLYGKQPHFYRPQAAQQTTTLRPAETEPEPGLATWYGSWRITGHLTASGRPFDPDTCWRPMFGYHSAQKSKQPISRPVLGLSCAATTTNQPTEDESSTRDQPLPECPI